MDKIFGAAESHPTVLSAPIKRSILWVAVAMLLAFVGGALWHRAQARPHLPTLVAYPHLPASFNEVLTAAHRAAIAPDAEPAVVRQLARLYHANRLTTEARACYAGKWLSFAYGRRLVVDDEPSRTTIAAELAGSENVARAITTTRAFLFRAPNEVGQ